MKVLLYRARACRQRLLEEAQQQQVAASASRRRTISETALRKLQHVPLHYREVIELAYLQHLSDQEIAAHLRLPLGTVKTRLARGVYYLLTMSSHSNKGSETNWNKEECMEE
ncbi:sigma factor-like helix-turn-helix DNA-binding protein [Ktedonobacter sp. SOSP1-52]|uniref:sigma factor-like helix-turn-helix DNA-binding protein n=1 Tax=Ktedonobacter sp. SOSP1-52 TaxID=2778366 RepID=UPI001F416FE6|nr:sigma factor-like helix-turn-helix DNA-binding protein [Ktedonobacter sp. SOSP1-52]